MLTVSPWPRSKGETSLSLLPRRAEGAVLPGALRGPRRASGFGAGEGAGAKGPGCAWRGGTRADGAFRKTTRLKQGHGAGPPSDRTQVPVRRGDQGSDTQRKVTARGRSRQWPSASHRPDGHRGRPSRTCLLQPGARSSFSGCPARDFTRSRKSVRQRGERVSPLRNAPHFRFPPSS